MNWIESFLEQHPEQRPWADLIAVPPDINEMLGEFPELGREMDLINAGYQFVSHDGQGHGVTRFAQYAICRCKGNTHKLSVALAMQQICGGATNDTFWSGRPPFWKVFGEDYANDVRKRLKANGIKLGENQEYLPELARFRGDPEAIIPTHAARDHIRSVCERRGWACDGAVSVAGREPLTDPHASGTPLGEDIIRRNMREMIKQNPELAHADKRELRQHVLDRHGPSK